MAKPKGSPKTGGRAPGTPNRATNEARQAIALFVDKNAHRLEDWLDQVAHGTHNGKPDPAKAFELFQSVVEYHIPKLARTEVTGQDGGPIESTLNVDALSTEVLAQIMAAKNASNQG